LAGFGFLTALFGAEPPYLPAQATAVWVEGRGPTAEYFISNPKGQPQKLVIGTGARGPAVTIAAVGQPIVILRKASPSGKGTDAGLEKAGEIAWPSGAGRKFLLLLSAGATDAKAVSPPIKGIALVDDLNGFPVDTFRILNLLNTELYGRVGDIQRPVAPGLSTALPYPVPAVVQGEKRTQNFAVGFARSGEGGKTELFYNGRVDAWPHSRTLILILPGQIPKAEPNVRILFDVIPAQAVKSSSGVKP
jgi:hypothetical protein